MGVEDYVYEPDGRVRDLNGTAIAFFDSDGTIMSHQYGPRIGFLDTDGTVRDTLYGRELGFVESSGRVLTDRYGTAIGTVKPPEIFKKGALLILL